MRMKTAIFGLATGMALATAAHAGAPQNIDPNTGDPVIPEYQTQQPPAAQTTITTETRTTGATNYGSMNDAPATHKEPASVGEAGRQIGKDAGTAGKTVGSTTREVTKTIGHGVRDTTKAIGHGTRDFFRGIGNGWDQAGD